MGDSKICEPSDSLVDREIPQALLIPSYEGPINSVVDNTYPKLFKRIIKMKSSYNV